MKNFVLILLCFGLFGVGFCDSAGCKDEDITKIGSCYENYYGNMTGHSWPFDFVDVLYPSKRSKEYWRPICIRQLKLNDCIGSDRIQNCFNMDNIQNLPFVKAYPAKSMNKYLIYVFILTEHFCDKLFKFSDEDYNCYKHSFNNTVIKICDSKTPIFFGTRNETLNCATEAVYKKCGKTVGCFQRKNAYLSTCWSDFLFYCGSCDGISVTNNQIDGLCNDDNVGEKDLDAGLSFNNLN